MEIYCLDTKKKYDWDLPSGKEEVVALCPECSAKRTKHSKVKCLCWNTIKETGICQHCNVKYVKVNDNFAPTKDYIKKEYKCPEESGELLLDPVVEHFIANRGISKKTLDIANVTNVFKFNPTKKKDSLWIMFNYYRNEKLVNIKYKTSTKDFQLESGAELIFYNLDAVSGSEVMVITEGEEDCLSFIEVGITNVVSVPNGAGKKNLTYIDNSYDNISHIKEFYIAVDEDEPGKILKTELIRRFGAENCKTISFSHLEYTDKHGEIHTCKDANNVLVHHGKSVLLDCYNNAKDVPLKGVYSIDEGYNDIIDLWQTGMEKGEETQHKELNKKITWITPALAVWTGIPGVGKSEVVDEVAVGLNILHDWKVAYYSPENFPIKLHISKIVSKIAGSKFSSDKMTRDELDTTLDYVKNNFYFLYQEEATTNAEAGDMTIDRILEQARGLVKKKGIKQLVIDPVSRIADYTDESANTRTIGKILNKLDRFAKMNDVLIHLVVHPTKMRKDKDSGEYEVPTLYDCSGSANFFNSAFYGLAVHRDNGFTYLYINKVKFKHLGEKGFVKFKYHYDSGRLIEADDSGYADLEHVYSYLSKPIETETWTAEDLTHPLKKPEPIPEVTESNPQKDAVLHNYPKQDTNSDILPNDDFDDVTNINIEEKLPF